MSYNIDSEKKQKQEERDRYESIHRNIIFRFKLFCDKIAHNRVFMLSLDLCVKIYIIIYILCTLTAGWTFISIIVGFI